MDIKFLREMQRQNWVKEKGLDIVCHLTYINDREHVKGDKITLYYNETLLYNKKFIFECMFHGKMELFEFDFTRDELSKTPLDLDLTMKEAYPDRLVFMRERKDFF